MTGEGAPTRQRPAPTRLHRRHTRTPASGSVPRGAAAGKIHPAMQRQPARHGLLRQQRLPARRVREASLRGVLSFHKVGAQQSQHATVRETSAGGQIQGLLNGLGLHPELRTNSRRSKSLMAESTPQPAAPACFPCVDEEEDADGRRAHWRERVG